MSLLPSNYEVRFGFAGNAYFHMIVFREAGAAVPTHQHAYAHVSRVLRGKVRYERGDGHVQEMEGSIEGPGLVEVPAGIAHTFIALSDDAVVECVHMLRDEDGEPLPFDCSNRDAMAATARL